MLRRGALLSQPLALPDRMILPMPLPLLRSEFAAGFWQRTICRASGTAWPLLVHTAFRTGCHDVAAQISSRSSPRALGIPPHACARVPTSLSTCQGSSSLSTLVRAGPNPCFAAEVLRVKGCSQPGPQGPNSDPPRAGHGASVTCFPRLNPRPLPEAHKCRRAPHSSVTHRELSQDLSCLISALKESPSRWVTHQWLVMCSAWLKHWLSSSL